ncbi:F-box only protein 47-like [Diadema setosum]|uniref:F-box only protein 47-like n=1 Tax=Diadema setosum TaxID=31175 RepID=UPI003B3ACD24
MAAYPTASRWTGQARRKSVRLLQKEREKGLREDMNNMPLGYFSVLPEEIIYHVFSKLSSTELSRLSLVSKSLRDIVIAYNLTRQGLNRLMGSGCALRSKSKRNKVDLCQCFKNLGLLVKRSTCLYPTRERLRLMETLFHELVANFTIESSRINHCFGRFFSIFVKGWQERECLRAYFAVINYKNVVLKMTNVISGKPGEKADQEMEVRSFLRGVILDQCESLEDLGMWLHFILQPYPMVHQARLLLLIYGSLSKRKDQINWTFMSLDDQNIASHVASAPFRDLAVAIKALHGHSEWNTDSVISVLEEVTACPNEWLDDNVARLLCMCGEAIVIPVLASKAINGKMTQLSSIIVGLAVVTYLSNLNMSWLVKILREVCDIVPSEHDVVGLVDATVGYFRTVILAMPDQGDAGRMIMFEDAVSAFTCFTRELMMTSIKPSTKAGRQHLMTEE